MHFQRPNHRVSILEGPSGVHSRLCGWSYLVKFLSGNLSYTLFSEPSRTALLPDVTYTLHNVHPPPVLTQFTRLGRSIFLKGLSHEIKVSFLGSLDRKNPFNIPAEWLQLILSTFLCLIFKLKSPSGTSFGLYFAFAEYRTDDSNSPADRYNTSEILQRYSTVR